MNGRRPVPEAGKQNFVDRVAPPFVNAGCASRWARVAARAACGTKPVCNCMESIAPPWDDTQMLHYRPLRDCELAEGEEGGGVRGAAERGTAFVAALERPFQRSGIWLSVGARQSSH